MDFRILSILIFFFDNWLLFIFSLYQNDKYQSGVAIKFDFEIAKSVKPKQIEDDQIIIILYS